MKGSFIVSILITRGAGFIGSHTVKLFYEPGFEIGVLDNLVNGRRKECNLELSVPIVSIVI